MIRRCDAGRGFTLVELLAVVVILAVLAGVALPRFLEGSAAARASACRGVLSGVRAGIANFYAETALEGGEGRYPTLAELTTPGVVLQSPIAANPYNGSSRVTAGTRADSIASPRPRAGRTAGWVYYGGSTSASPAVFWANSNVAGENDF